MNDLRPLWIATCALAVIGGFFVVLQSIWMLKLESEWLPYLAQPLGAVLAGLVLGGVVSASPRAAFVGGFVGVALLVLITYALPRAFTLTAARSAHALIVVPAVAIACGLGCALGMRISAATSRVCVSALAALVAACAIGLGGRIAFALGLPADAAALVIFSIVAAAATGALVQALAGGSRERDVAIGVLVLMLWGAFQQAVLHATAALGFWDVFLIVAAPLAAARGARSIKGARVVRLRT